MGRADEALKGVSVGRSEMREELVKNELQRSAKYIDSLINKRIVKSEDKQP